MAEHGILMQDEMVRALLRPIGDPLRKTVTRRASNVWAKRKVGDLLWVRECRADGHGDPKRPDRPISGWHIDTIEGLRVFAGVLAEEVPRG